jgi:hypothetical protein
MRNNGDQGTRGGATAAGPGRLSESIVSRAAAAWVIALSASQDGHLKLGSAWFGTVHAASEMLHRVVRAHKNELLT